MTKPPVTTLTSNRTSSAKQTLAKQSDTPIPLAGASIMLMTILTGLILQHAVVNNGSYKLLFLTIPFALIAAFDYIKAKRRI